MLLAIASPASAAWGTPILGNAPAGVATDSSGNLYVVESFGNRLVKYSPTGAQLMAVGTPGTGQLQFNSPNGVAVESDLRGPILTIRVYPPLRSS